MTAIGGVLLKSGNILRRGDLARMEALLKPYGRDTSGLHIDRGSGFVRTLLRITPEDDFDRQPLKHSPSGLVMLFDGRLDNRSDLISSLKIDKASENRMADSEIALRAWLHWEDASLRRFVGDFSIACWQSSKRKLVLARDPLGARPLFWHYGSRGFVFGSMPKALFSQPGVPREVDSEAFACYIGTGALPENRTMYRSIQKVEPGEALVYENGQVRSTRFFDFDPRGQMNLPRDEDYVEAFKEIFEKSVSARLRCRGEVATQLSSGRDSSAVTAVAARLLQKQGKSLRAYTAVPRREFAGRAPRGHHADEGPLAGEVAQLFDNIQHILIETPRENPLQGLSEEIEVLDRYPLNPMNQGWINAINKGAEQRGVSVLLTGVFGNLTISHSGLTYLPWLLRHGKVFECWKELRAMKLGRQYRHVSWKWLIYLATAPFLPRKIWIAGERRRGAWIDSDSHCPLPQSILEEVQRGQSAKSMRVKMGSQSSWDNRSDTIASLKLMDCAEHSASANLFGLEHRDPTADRRLMEFCLAIPESQFLRRGETCSLLKRAMSGILPEAILESRSRGYQAADWLDRIGQPEDYRAALQTMRSHPTVSRLIDFNGLDEVIRAWEDGRIDEPGIKTSLRLKLLRGVAAGKFVQSVENNNRA